MRLLLQTFEDFLGFLRGALAHTLAEHHRRECEGVDHVEVGACVRSSDDRAVVMPEFASDALDLVVGARRRRHEVGLEIVSHGDVDHRVEGCLPLLLGDLADGAAAVLLE